MPYCGALKPSGVGSIVDDNGAVAAGVLIPNAGAVVDCALSVGKYCCCCCCCKDAAAADVVAVDVVAAGTAGAITQN